MSPPVRGKKFSLIVRGDPKEQMQISYIFLDEIDVKKTTDAGFEPAISRTLEYQVNGSTVTGTGNERLNH